MCVRDQAAIHITQVMGRVTRADVLPFPNLGNDWAVCAEIWFVVRDLLAWRFTKVNGGVRVHVHTCAPLFRISGTAGRIALRLGVWLEDH